MDSVAREYSKNIWTMLEKIFAPSPSLALTLRNVFPMKGAKKEAGVHIQVNLHSLVE
jgi:hypothetical protein